MNMIARKPAGIYRRPARAHQGQRLQALRRISRLRRVVRAPSVDVSDEQTAGRKTKSRRLPFVRHAEKSFTNGIATLVALLVVNDRKPEAEKVAADAKKEWDDASFLAGR